MLKQRRYFAEILGRYRAAIEGDGAERDEAVALLSELVSSGMSDPTCHEDLRKAFEDFGASYPVSSDLDAPESENPPGKGATDEQLDAYIADEMTYLHRDVSLARLERILAAAQKKSPPPRRNPEDPPKARPAPPPQSQGPSKEKVIAIVAGVGIVVLVIAGIVLIRRF